VTNSSCFFRPAFVAAGLLCMLGTAFESRVEAEDNVQYTVQGAIERTSLRAQTGKEFHYVTNASHFELFVRGNQWLVTLVPEEPDIYDFDAVVSSDGEDLYLLLRYRGGLSAAANPGLDRFPSDVTGEATVAKGNVPRFGVAEEAGAIWIAYASQACLSRGAGEGRCPVPFTHYVKRPPVQPGDLPLVQPVYWQTSDRPPFLPLSAFFVADDLEALGFQDKARPFPDIAFTNIIYEAKSFLTLDGLQFPRESVVSIHGIFKAPGAADTIKLAESMRITATNVVWNASIDSFQPEIRGATIVTEERLKHGSGLSFAYLSTHYWPGEDEVRNSPAYREALAAFEAAQPRLFEYPAILLSAVMVLLVVVIFVCRQNKRRSKLNAW
jgi:hypothetical protein